MKKRITSLHTTRPIYKPSVQTPAPEFWILLAYDMTDAVLEYASNRDELTALMGKYRDYVAYPFQRRDECFWFLGVDPPLSTRKVMFANSLTFVFETSATVNAFRSDSANFASLLFKDLDKLRGS